MILLLTFCFILLSIVHSQPEEAIEKFFAWSKEQGVDSSAMKWPVNFPATHRGVAATRDIKPGEIFLSVPIELAIYAKKIPRDTPLGKVLNHFDQYRGLMALLFCETMKGSKSFWAPFIDILPKDFSTVVVWPEEDVGELQDNRFYRYREQESYWLYRIYNETRNYMRQYHVEVPLSDEEALKLYEWVYSVVATRNFELSKEIRHIIVPVSDLLNHDEESSVRWDYKDGHFVMFSDSETYGFPAGTEIFTNYGANGELTNYRMLTVYGFVKRGNTRNADPISLPDSPAFPELQEYRLRVLNGNNFFELHYRINGPEVLSFFRLVTAQNRNEIENVLFPRSKFFENDVVDRCIAILTAELRKLPTSLGEDYELLPDSAGNRRIAIIFRMEKKILFVRTRNFCEDLQNELLCVGTRFIRGPKYVKLIHKLSNGN